jgi:hypothetical protein
MFVTITIYDVPAYLVEEFAQTIAKFYPDGISDALQDLMWKAVAEHCQKKL